MPLNFSRRLSGKTRSRETNWHLGIVLAFVAGAANAGGFLAVQQYTSHMTGIVSALADHFVIGAYGQIATGLGALISFLLGAASSSAMVIFSRRRNLHGEFALPLLVEAALLLCFGFLGARLTLVDGIFTSIIVLLLCFIMGLQNAVITKLSKAEIRTTHITGIVTDIGIELGKLAFGNQPRSETATNAGGDSGRLAVLLSLASSFFVGGIIGAYGFKHIGYIATVPLAILLMTLVIVPVADDIVAWLGCRK